jgi:hypothetical protein
MSFSNGMLVWTLTINSNSLPRLQLVSINIHSFESILHTDTLLLRDMANSEGERLIGEHQTGNGGLRQLLASLARSGSVLNANDHSHPGIHSYSNNPELHRRLEYFEDEFRRSNFFKPIQEVITGSQLSGVLTPPPPLAPSNRNNDSTSHKGASCWQQLAILSARTWTQVRHSRALLLAHYAGAAATALLAGLLFHRLPLTMAGVHSRLGCFFFSLACLAFSNLTLFGDILSDGALAALRADVAAGDYRPWVWLASKLLMDVGPLRVGPPLLYGAVLYPLVGLHFVDWPTSWPVVVIFLATLVLFNVALCAFVLAAGCVFFFVFPDKKKKKTGDGRRSYALMAVIGGLLVMLLFGGYLVNLNLLVRGDQRGSRHLLLRLLSSVSPVRWAFETLAVNELGHVVIRDPGIIDVDIPGTLILRQLGFAVVDDFFPTAALKLLLAFLSFLVIAVLVILPMNSYYYD